MEMGYFLFVNVSKEVGRFFFVYACLNRNG